ncbi:hypothetical protein MKX03_004108 [Papaver bracteatum]|nr:hypothetical protein MKX03_004108 [Papaver bracteatum]
MKEEFAYTILLADRIRDVVQETESFKLECLQVSKQVSHLSRLCRSVIKLSSNASTTNSNTSSNQCSFYERPNLEKTWTLVRKCRRGNCFLHGLAITITSAAEFRKIFILLDTSIGDLEWVLSVYDVNSLESNGITLSLPPIACNNPIISWVWSFIAVLHTPSLSHQGGISPLLRLLKQASSPESQIAASNALSNLATDRQRIRMIVSEHGSPIIVQALNDSTMSVQISVAKLVSRMAKNDPAAQEEFNGENIIRPLVSVLSFGTIVNHSNYHIGSKYQIIFHSQVNINKDLQGGEGGKSNVGSRHSGTHNKYERENESPDVKLDLQMNCLMTLMEITAAAEVNADLRRAAFKTNSPAAKVVTEQLLTLVQDESNPSLQIPAIKSIGSYKTVVLQLSNSNLDVATEAAIAMGKFTCPENFICREHSKTIVNYGGVTPLLRLLKPVNDRPFPSKKKKILLCYLVLNVDSGEGLEMARSALEGAVRSSILMQNYPSLRDLILKAISHLALYENAVYTLMQQ